MNLKLHIEWPPAVHPSIQSMPLLKHLVECSQRYLKEEAERQHQFNKLRVITGWDEKRIIDTAQRLKLSFTQLYDLILKTGDFNQL